MKRFIILTLVALLVATAVFGVGVVSAQTFAPDARTTNVAPHAGNHHPGGPGRAGTVRQHRAHWRELAVIAQTLNMQEQDLIAAFRAGKTVADVAQEQGVDLATVVDALVAPRAQRLQRAVDNGRLTQAQADALLALERIRVEDRLQRPFPLDPLMIAAQVLGMEPRDLLAELRAGKSVADVAAEKGVALDDIVNAILARKVERLNQLVADGRLTQDQADTLIAMARDRVSRMLNRHPRPCRCGPHRGGQGKRP